MGKSLCLLFLTVTRHTPVDSFTDGKMHGETVEFENARIVMVGEEGKSFDALKSKLKQTMVFSA